MRDRSDVIERIRKLMTKQTAAGCTEAEAQAAAAMASRIMAQHNLDVAEVESYRDLSDSSYIEEPATEWKRRTDLETRLIAAILDRYFFVETCFSVTNGHSRLLLFGTRENVDAARFVFSSLRAAFDDLWRRYRLRTGCRASDRRAYTAGLARGFKDKLYRERVAMDRERLARWKTDSGTALAVIQGKLRAAFEEANPSVTTMRPAAPIRGRAAYDEGIRDGRNISLSRPVEHKPTRGIGDDR